MIHNKKPLITTIIPTYRRPKLLRRAIQSVLNQSFSNFLLCIYDNASGDETKNVVDEFAEHDSRVEYHCHSQNIGAVANFNYGMERVETPFFSFLSDDDILLPDFYKVTLEGFEKYPDSIFSAGSVISMNDKKEVVLDQLSLWARDGYFTPPEGLYNMVGMKHPTWTGVLFRKEVVSEVGILDKDVGSLVDMDFELRIAARFPFVIIKKPCAIFVHHPLSNCSNINLSFFWPGWLKIISNLTEDGRIPLNVRTNIEIKLINQIKDILFGTGFIIKRSYGEAFSAAKILREHFNENTRASILEGTTKICKHFPPAYIFVFMRDRIRKIIDKYKRRTLQKKFNKYTAFLNL